MASKLKITQTRSAIRQTSRQKRTLEALGLRRMHQTVLHNDTPQIRGMVAKVSHLVTLEIDTTAKPVAKKAVEKKVEATPAAEVQEVVGDAVEAKEQPKKTAAKKAASKKTAAKKSTAKKSTAKKTSAKKTTAKKTARKTTAKKAAKKSTSRKSSAKKAAGGGKEDTGE